MRMLRRIKGGVWLGRIEVRTNVFMREIKSKWIFQEK